MNSTNPTAPGELQRRFETLEKARLQSPIKSAIWNTYGKIGNALLRKPPPSTTINRRRLLNLGCGSNKVAGWINADFFRLHYLVLHRNLAPDWMIDLRRPLECPDDYWDGLFIEHTNEHLTYSENLTLLSELFRTMKPGGTIRIVVPDLDRYLQFRELAESHPKFRRYSSLPEAISNLTQNHNHASVWNHDLFREVLLSVGFSDVTSANYGKGRDSELILDTASHQWESLYIEARKI